MGTVHDRAARIRLVVLDVDGVLTDARLLFGASGEEIKTFHTRDGHGIKALARAGVGIAVISGRRSPAVERRMQELGVTEVHQGIGDKLPVFESVLATFGLDAGAVACMGDDVPDLPLLERAALAVCPADAHPRVAEACHWQTTLPGGRGAVRELCDLLIGAASRPRGDDPS